MVESITVTPEATVSAEYPVHIGVGARVLLREFIDAGQYSKVFILTDSTVATFWQSEYERLLPEAKFLVVAPGERNKTSAGLEQIWHFLKEENADRASLLINIGGGVLGDMGGFAACTYMRGMDFVQVPTTLLAQVDASVGGKLAIDFAGVKNLIGLFGQPKAVIADVEMLGTLDEAELLSGFAEVLKHGLIQDAQYWEIAIRKHASAYTNSELEELVAGSVAIKASVVAADTMERGMRKILNFGHTSGHAFEALSHEGHGVRPLLHGEAVGVGMLVASKISSLLGMIDTETHEQISGALINAGVARKLSGCWDFSTIYSRMLSDKKNVGQQISWTLLTGIGTAVFDRPVAQSVVRQAMAEYVEELQ